MTEWRPIETAPRNGREKILLKTPYDPLGVAAYTDTWWVSGFSAECKPTHWSSIKDNARAALKENSNG